MNPDWKFQSRLKISISIEIFNPGPSEFPTKNRGLLGGSLEIFNLDWKFQSRRAILKFFNLWALRDGFSANRFALRIAGPSKSNLFFTPCFCRPPQDEISGNMSGLALQNFGSNFGPSSWATQGRKSLCAASAGCAKRWSECRKRSRQQEFDHFFRFRDSFGHFWSLFLMLLSLFSHQRKAKGQQLKGKIVSALFHTFPHFFKISPPGFFQRECRQGQNQYTHSYIIWGLYTHSYIIWGLISRTITLTLTLLNCSE